MGYRQKIISNTIYYVSGESVSWPFLNPKESKLTIKRSAEQKRPSTKNLVSGPHILFSLYFNMGCDFRLIYDAESKNVVQKEIIDLSRPGGRTHGPQKIFWSKYRMWESITYNRFYVYRNDKMIKFSNIELNVW